MDRQPRITRDDIGGLTPVVAPEPVPPPGRVWTEADWDVIQRGHKSAEMDDRWHAYVEGRRLYLHRSWTGLGVYEAEFGPVQDGWQVTAAVVESDRSRYRRQDDDYESALLEALVDGILLGRYDGPGYQRWMRARDEHGMP